MQTKLKAADVLAPLLRNHAAWTLHYPMYVNTFCLAYHLVASLRASNPLLQPNVIRNEWWQGRPQFTYRTDIEIFVAVDTTKVEIKHEGHRIDDDQVIEFTRYDVKSIFRRRAVPGDTEEKSANHPIFLITDIRTTAQAYVDQSGLVPDTWVPGLGPFDKSRVEIRNAWERELNDLTAPNPKIYLFGAPMTYILSQNTESIIGSLAKYESFPSKLTPVPTYYVLRCNSPKAERLVEEIGESIKTYYRSILDCQDEYNLISDSLVESYARMAVTSGEANPFSDIFGAPRRSLAAPGELTKRYREILQNHHSGKIV